MRIKYHKEFVKNYRKRITPNFKLVTQFKKRLELFMHNPGNQLLKDRRLVGKKQSFRAFSVSGNIRVVYKIINEELWLYDVGSHNQVY